MGSEMRALLTAASISLVLGTAAATGLAAPTQKPSLVLNRHTVQGFRFHRREAVRVTFTWNGRSTTRARTNGAGSFTAPLPATYDPCVGPLTIVANGLTGDKAKVFAAQRACLPPP